MGGDRGVTRCGAGGYFAALFTADSTDTYAGKINATKQHYPFDNWRTHYQQAQIRQWDPNGVEDTNAVQAIFDQLIAQLIALGEQAPEQAKVNLFEEAIEATNDYEGLIMTEQREELVMLTDEITEACGLDPGDYADGAGLADEWRCW